MSHLQQRLFDHMKDEHGLTLLESEMFAIEDIVKKMYRYTLKRKGDTLTAVAKTEQEAKHRINACFTNRHGKPGPKELIELLAVEAAPRVDVHFYSKSKKNREAVDRRRLRKKRKQEL